MLTFDPETHVYRWDDAVVPSVTQVLESAGIIDYSSIPRGIRDYALQRGSLVHRACELWDEGDLDMDTLSDVLAPYVRAYIDFRETTGFTPILSEYRAYSTRWGYAGTLDRLGQVGNRLWLIDLKSGGMPRWARLQTAAYHELIKGLHPCVERYALRLDKDGRFYLSDPFTDPSDFYVFTCALQIARWKEAA
jgi:hypothetical protein